MKLDVFDECYDLTQDTIPNLLLNATDDELEYLGLSGLVCEHSVHNLNVKDLIVDGTEYIIPNIADLGEYINIDKLREMLKELKDVQRE